jgi:hypothetical protein
LKVAISMWLWWSDRDKAEEGDPFRSTEYFNFTISRLSVEYKKAHEKKLVEKGTSLLQWKTPAQEVVEINTDGSFRERSKSGGWGFSIREHEGQALAAGAGHIPHASDALQTGAEAVLHEINCAEKIGIARIIAETYAKVVEQALTCSEYDLAEMGTLF